MKDKATLKNITLKDLANLVGATLAKHHIDAVLVGGACVSIYSKNIYQSGDLDYITDVSLKDLIEPLKTIGFIKKGSNFTSKDCPLYIEFPPPPIAIGNEVPIKKFNKIKSIKLLTPTDCVKDRLCAYYHWNDPQSLQQALMVAKAQKINIRNIREWSKAENALEKFKRFEALLKTAKK